MRHEKKTGRVNWSYVYRKQHCFLPSSTSRTGIEFKTRQIISVLISYGIIHNAGHVFTSYGWGINISFFGWKESKERRISKLCHGGFYSLAEVCRWTSLFMRDSRGQNHSSNLSSFFLFFEIALKESHDELTEYVSFYWHWRLSTNKITRHVILGPL